MKRLLVAGAMMLGSISTAEAEDVRVYAGITGGVMGIEYQEPTLSINQNVGAGLLKLGMDANDYFGVEFRIGAAGNGSSAVGATTVELGVDLLTSYLVKLQYPVAQDFRIYGLAGATTAKLTRKQTVTGTSVVLINDSARKIALSYGAGAEFFVTDKVSISGEWIQYWKDAEVGTNITTTLWSAGGAINYYF